MNDRFNIKFGDSVSESLDFDFTHTKQGLGMYNKELN